MTFGEKITRTLTRKGMTQKQLADKARISESAVCNYIKGVRLPILWNVQAIATALDLTMAELLEGVSCD